MGSAVIWVALLCAPQQWGDDSPTLVVRNDSDRFIEFRIKASNRGRRWSRLPLRSGMQGTIHLQSDDPFDVEIWRWDGHTWGLDSSQQLQLKAACNAQGNVFGLPVTRSISKPVHRTGQPSNPEPVYVFEEIGQASLPLISNGGGLFLPIQSIDDHAPPYPPVPKPRQPRKK